MSLSISFTGNTCHRSEKINNTERRGVYVGNGYIKVRNCTIQHPVFRFSWRAIPYVLNKVRDRAKEKK